MCDRDVCAQQACHLTSAAETCDRGADAAAAAAVADVNAAVAAAAAVAAGDAAVAAAAAVDAAASAVAAAAAGVADDLRDCCHLPDVDSVSCYKG